MRRSLFAVSVIAAAIVAAWCVTGYQLRHATTSAALVHTETAYERVMRTGVLRCGYVAWPPFFDKDPKTGQVTGMVKNVMDELTATIGLKVEYQEAVLGQQPQDLKSGKYDSFCFDSYLMPKASKFVDYSKSWGTTPMYIYGRMTDPEVTSLRQLNDTSFTFSTMDGDLSLDLATRLFPKAHLLSLASSADPSLLMLNVTTRKADAVITDPITTQKFNATNKDSLKPLYKDPIATYPLMISVAKGEVDLQNMLNYALDIFIDTGNYNAIIDKYDPEHVVLRIDTKRN